MFSAGTQGLVGERKKPWAYQRNRGFSNAPQPMARIVRQLPGCLRVVLCGAFLVASSVKIVRQGGRSVSLPRFLQLSLIGDVEGFGFETCVELGTGKGSPFTEWDPLAAIGRR